MVLISVGAIGQRKHHAKNNITDISFTSKKFKSGPLIYNVTNLFDSARYFMPNEGASSLPFQVARFKDLRIERILETGERNITVEGGYFIAVPFLNKYGAHVDRFTPAGLKATKGRVKKGRWTIETEHGDYSYDPPTMMDIDGKTYLFFKYGEYGEYVLITPLDDDIVDILNLETLKITFKNVNDFYVLEKYIPSKKKVIKPKGIATAEERIHLVVKKETLTSISILYGISIASLKKLNGLKSDLILVGQKLIIE